MGSLTDCRSCINYVYYWYAWATKLDYLEPETTCIYMYSPYIRIECVAVSCSA